MFAVGLWLLFEKDLRKWVLCAPCPVYVCVCVLVNDYTWRVMKVENIETTECV